MPMHDWTVVGAGIFHAFRFEWIGALRNALNSGLLPKGYFALAERNESGPPRVGWPKWSGVAIRHITGFRRVAFIEIVIPAHKQHAQEVRAGASKVEELLRSGIHVMILDVFPAGRHDPDGLHAALWRRLFNRSVIRGRNVPSHPWGSGPGEGRRTMASYESDDPIRAYARHPAVGEALPDLPLFLHPDECVNVPLEATYAEAWAALPEEVRAMVPSSGTPG